MSDEKKYVEIRFRLPIADFEEYEIEAKEVTETLGYIVSPTAQIRADAIKQAKIKRQNRQVIEQPKRQLTAFEELNLMINDEIEN